MNKRLRSGKSSELIVAGELIRQGVDVYFPAVDDQAIDLIIRVETEGEIRYYDLQVKSVRGYSRIVGVHNLEDKPPTYLLVIHYRHDRKPDEFFYLTRDQALEHVPPATPGQRGWGDLIINAPERVQYAGQNLEDLARGLSEGTFGA